ncbi:hypothetical protein LJD40_26455, partial [Escherichia coli]|nr:hypothetical protein [Escherichia coli]
PLLRVPLFFEGLRVLDLLELRVHHLLQVFVVFGDFDQDIGEFPVGLQSFQRSLPFEHNPTLDVDEEPGIARRLRCAIVGIGLS